MEQKPCVVSALYLAARGRLLSYYSRATVIAVPMERREGEEMLIPATRLLHQSGISSHEVLVLSLLPHCESRSPDEMEEWVKEQRVLYRGLYSLAFYAVENTALRYL